MLRFALRAARAGQISVKLRMTGRCRALSGSSSDVIVI